MRIDPRFNGPPDSGNGGYVCGELARRFDPGVQASGIRVRLRKPPPLDTDLEIKESDTGLSLNRGADVLAEAWPDALTMELPDPVTIERATEAATLFRGHEEHVFPTCFVCGPDRAAGDGLRIFPGPLGDAESRVAGAGRTFAATWMPDVSLTDSASSPLESGEGEREAKAFVSVPFVWAALDCPGCFSFPQPEAAILLLGELTAVMRAPIPDDEMTVLLSWQIVHEGRKHFTGSAVYSAKGDCLGFARGTWIEIAQSAPL